MEFKTYKSWRGRVIYGQTGECGYENYLEVQIRKMALGSYDLQVTNGYKYLTCGETVDGYDNAKSRAIEILKERTI